MSENLREVIVQYQLLERGFDAAFYYNQDEDSKRIIKRERLKVDSLLALLSQHGVVQVLAGKGNETLVIELKSGETVKYHKVRSLGEEK